MEHIDLQIQTDQPASRIAPEIFGHFSEHPSTCMYGGIYVGEDSSVPNTDGVRNDVIDAFRQIRMPVLRALKRRPTLSLICSRGIRASCRFQPSVQS